MGRKSFTIDWITALTLLCLGSFGLFILPFYRAVIFYGATSLSYLAFTLMITIAQLDALILWWAAPMVVYSGKSIFASFLFGTEYPRR